MTRDRAIEILIGLQDGSSSTYEAIRMAIQALEREQQRQEDIYICQYCYGEVHKNYTYCPFCGEVLEGEDE